MFPRKNFLNLHAVTAILVLFQQFSGKFRFNFLTLILSASPNMMHFVRTFRLCVLKAQGLLLSKRFEIMKKLYTSKTFLKMSGGRMHILILPPLAISCRNHQKSQAYFSHLAPLVLFLFY